MYKKILMLTAVALAATACTTKQLTRTPAVNTNTQSSVNSKAPEPSVSANGLTVKITKEGSGPVAKAGDRVTVNYTGTLTDGTKFDSSLNPGRTPYKFNLGAGEVIQGWDLGVAGMKVGERRTLTIAPELGYGPGGYGPIPPNATLHFDVELLGINGTPQ